MVDFTLPTRQWFLTPKPCTVTQTITSTQEGRVKYQGSYWPARWHEPILDSSALIQIAPQQSVLVVGREGITLLIKRHV